MDLDDLSAMNMKDRLRKNAELIARRLGDEWRSEVAEEMESTVSDVGVGPVS